jgi:hypothetical protein
MVLLHREYTLETLALTAVSTWEAAVLLTGHGPTVTSQVRRLPKPARALLVAGLTAWMIEHFSVIGGDAA